jgi:hypothetical protein
VAHESLLYARLVPRLRLRGAWAGTGLMFIEGELKKFQLLEEFIVPAMQYVIVFCETSPIICTNNS